MTLALKRLTTQNLEAALAKASTYRDLNQPEEAESICRDVLDVDPENVHALRVLGLALTDRFGTAWVGLFEEAVAVFERAEKLAPPESPDPILRYNRCVRLLTTHPLLLAAAGDPREDAVHLGD